MTPPPPRKTEAEIWREQAHEALAQVSKTMQFFLHASAQLVMLTQIHEPDDFTHCKACNSPWPCATITVVQNIARHWAALQQEEETDG